MKKIYYARFNEYIYDPIEKGIVFDKLKELNRAKEKDIEAKDFINFLMKKRELRHYRLKYGKSSHYCEYQQISGNLRIMKD